MAEKKTINPFLKIGGIVLCVLAVLFTSFHLWFRDHAEEVIEELVSVRSNGKINLKLKNFRFNYFSRKMELHNALFYTTDSIEAPVAYRFGVRKLKIEVRSLWQLIFNGKLLIDSLSLVNPDVEVIKLRESRQDERDISVSQEMGRVYNSIRDALDFLNAKSLLIEEGSFSVINKMESAKLPVKITHIHFRVDNPSLDSSGQSPPGTAMHSDNMVLRTHDQAISLPDGNHRISFRNLRINVLKQSIHMDSCTIAAEKTDSSNASFILFFDTLSMVSVDFGALYRKNLIKADTVYCTRPDIKLRITLKEEKDKNKKPPTLKQIIQPLTGNLQLGYVAIVNAGIDIAAERNNRSTTFKSENDNIEITDLQINSDSTDPLSVKSFAMSIRDYETINRNRTLAFRFDSVKFSNSQFILSNFTVKTLASKHIHDAERNYIIPRLELSNLSWDELLFNRNIKATKAVLYSPVMNYKRLRPAKTNQRVTLFRDLSNIDAIMELQQLQVVNGSLNMELDKRTKINLENTDMIVSSNELLESKNIKSLQRSFNQLQFKRGIININDIKAELKDVHFTGKQDQVEATEVIVYDPAKTLSATARNVLLNEIYYNDSTRSLSVDGFAWAQASVSLGSLRGVSTSSRSSVLLKNIAGNNTSLSIRDSNQTISTFIRSLNIDELRKPVNSSTAVTGLHATGNSFVILRGSLKIEAREYDINDTKNSQLIHANFVQTGDGDSYTVNMPRISFIPDIRQIMAGNYRFGAITIEDPVIDLRKNVTDAIPDSQEKRLPDFSVEDLTVINPYIRREIRDTIEGNTLLEWRKADSSTVKSEWKFKNIQNNNTQKTITIRQVDFGGPGFSFTGKKGKHFSVDKGDIHSTVENIAITNTPNNTTEWQATVKNILINNLNRFKTKNNGEFILQDASAANLFLSSKIINSISAIISNSPSFHVSNHQGSYSDSNNVFQWSNLAFDQGKRSLAVDTFLFRPALSLDSFIAQHPYQVDYVTLNTGKAILKNADIATYINDSTIKAGALIVDHPFIYAYRDNLNKQFDPGHLKPMPTTLVKRFPLFVSLDTIQMRNGSVTYTQLEKTTGKAGIVPLTQLNATLLLVRNYDLHPHDSMQLTASAMLSKDIPIKLFARESYEDSLGGMRLLLNFGRTDLTKLNSMLPALISAKLKSGYLDTMNMDVTANEYLAFGEMNMRYRKLKVAVLVKGDEKKKTFKTRIINFAANSLLVKNKNTGHRKGIVYFQRNRDRLFFNYLVKMTFRGVANSVGLKIDKKKIKQHQRELKKKGAA